MSKVNWTSKGHGGRLLKYQGGKCCYCERAVVVHRFRKGPMPRDMATIDHLKPKSHGGTRALGNIAIACLECNQERGTTPWNIFKSIKMGETEYFPDNVSWGVFRKKIGNASERTA